MNPVHIVESARPEIDTMPIVARRHLRERLFTVSTGSHAGSHTGSGGIQINPPNASRANALRVGALVLLGAVAAGGLAFSASRSGPDDGAETSSSTPPVATVAADLNVNTVVQVPAPTVAPTTTTPAVVGSQDTPLLLPPERSRLDELAVNRKQLGGSSLLLRAPDLTTVSLRETDGIAPVTIPPDDHDDGGEATTPPIPPRQFAGFEVTQPGDPGTYDVSVPCGTLQVREGIGRLPFRPEIVELFNSMSLANGSIDITLPTGWGLIDVGPGADEFVLGIPAEVGGRNVTVTLTQYPNGSIAVAGFGDRQYAPVTFRGEQAWISRNPDVPGEFEIIGMLGTTAFSASARDIALSELDLVLQSLLPSSVEDWITRFGPLGATEDPDIRTCQQQPEFNVRQGS